MQVPGEARPAFRNVGKVSRSTELANGAESGPVPTLRFRAMQRLPQSIPKRAPPTSAPVAAPIRFQSCDHRERTHLAGALAKAAVGSLAGPSVPITPAYGRITAACEEAASPSPSAVVALWLKFGRADAGFVRKGKDRNP